MYIETRRQYTLYFYSAPQQIIIGAPHEALGSIGSRELKAVQLSHLNMGDAECIASSGIIERKNGESDHELIHLADVAAAPRLSEACRTGEQTRRGR